VTAIHAARVAAMLRRDLGLEVTLESGPYGSFQVRSNDEVLVDGGPLAFAGVLPSLDSIRARVTEHLAGG
jgi:hypothetical protein